MFNFGPKISYTKWDTTVSIVVFCAFLVFGCRPMTPVQHNKAAATQWLAKDYKGAIAHYREILKVNPNDTQTKYLLGTALKNDHQYQEATRVFREVVAFGDPTFSRAAQAYIQSIEKKKVSGL